MKYVPGTINANDIDIAQSPFFGGEFAIFLTHVAAKNIGQVDLTAADVGTYTDNTATAIKALGANLQLVALTPIQSAVNPVIKLAGLDDTGTPVAMDGTATFAPPARAAYQLPNFQAGFGVELVEAVALKKFTAITGLAAVSPITGGGPNQSFGLFELPEAADYSLIACTSDFNVNTKSRMAKGIDCGMVADAFVKRGKTQPGDISFSAKLKGMGEGIARFDGAKCTLMAVGIKDGQVTTDRWVLTQCVLNIKVSLPEGDGEATISAEGKFVDHLFFVAP